MLKMYFRFLQQCKSYRLTRTYHVSWDHSQDEEIERLSASFTSQNNDSNYATTKSVRAHKAPESERGSDR